MSDQSRERVSHQDDRLTERDVYRMHREAGYSRAWAVHAAVTYAERPSESAGTQRPSWFVTYEQWLDKQDRRLNDWLDEQIRANLDEIKQNLGMEVDDA